ncbi:hypothetical protein [Streptomyces boluensis]|uniref:Uncharacterized protein n=1 Tax=Streptomyces boluensis TaxID=1775135 RepID=A0A964USI0_9ACTN|nr:hypothetical protein [Streptomyces boluensis]NBE54633.1 hypothetical protein [Streptomyces boluensis]
MRPARDPSADRSATPIYDALYAEWRRCFRALPGDRSGEEEPGFTGFGSDSRAHGGGSHTGHTPPGFWFTEVHRSSPGNRPQAALPPAQRRES